MMKKRLTLYAVTCSVLIAALVGTSGAINFLPISGSTTGSQAVITATLRCWVSDTIMGSAIKTVRASRYTEYTYWVNYLHGSTMNRNLKLIIVITGVAGRCVEKKMTFELSFPSPGYGNGAYSNVPFAIIDWGGGVEHGPAYVVPVVDGVYQWAYMYRFTVTG
jgi:hypothetical protein